MYRGIKRNWPMFVQCKLPVSMSAERSELHAHNHAAVDGLPFRNEQNPVQNAFSRYVERVMFVGLFVVHSQ